MGSTLRTTSIALLAAGALAVAGCGGDDAPSGSAPAGNGTDRAFVADMVPHHRGAVEMAEIALRRGESPFVKQLAEDIVRTQGEEITTLREQDRELAAAGVKAGELGGGHSAMAMDDSAALETADPFDRAFLESMVPHHVEAIEMAKVEREEGEDPELKRLAGEIIAGQERELRAMRGQLD